MSINLTDKQSIKCPYCGLPMIWTYEWDNAIGDYPVCFCNSCKITIKAENDSSYSYDAQIAEYAVDKLISVCKRKVKVRKRPKCHCWQKGHWYIKDMDICLGTREQEPCDCKGDTRKCSYYPEKRRGVK